MGRLDRQPLGWTWGLAAVLGLAAPGLAQESPPGPAPEPAHETVIVADPAAPRDPNVTRFSRDRIENQGARTAAEVLEGDPGISATTGSRGERIFLIRGFDQRQAAVLLDGMPAYIPYDGQMDLGMVPVELVDHVTIVKGPASVVYGPNGLGGAVNVVTRLPGEGPLLEVLEEFRDASTYRLAGYHALGAGPVAWQVFGGLDQVGSWPLSASFRPTANQGPGNRLLSDSRKVHGGAGLRVRVAPGHDLRLSLLVLDGERGVPPSTTEIQPRYWRFTEWRAFGASLVHEGVAGPLGMDETAWVRLYDNLLDGYDDATCTTQDSPRALHSRYRDRQFGGRVRLRYRRDLPRDVSWTFRTWIGAQHEQHDGDSGGSSPTWSRTLVTLAPESEFGLGPRWGLLAALQVDVEVPGSLPLQDPRTTAGWGPLLSVRWSPIEMVRVQVTGARRTRFPSLKERFSDARGYRLPNPTLGPESAWHVGLDVSARPARWVNVSVAAWDAEVDDLIDRVALGGGIDQLQNLGRGRLLGVEAAVELHPWRYLDARLGYAFLDARRLDASATHATLPYRPAHQAVMAIASAPLSWLEVSTQVRVVGPRDYQDPETRQWDRLPTSVTWDARLEVRPARWLDLWVQARNLLDADIQSEYGFPEPGRQVFLGARFRSSIDRH